jgi:ubiquinone/menaquinone biosynthesis C-methylase UbiE
MILDGSLQAASVYNKIAPIYASTFYSPADFICDFLKLLGSNGKILDVGCGHGINSNYMRSKGFKVTGIDLSDEMIRLARARYLGIEFDVADMRKMVFDDAHFDGLFISFSLIHLPKIDVLGTLRLFNKLLKKNGIIYVSVQLGKSKEIYQESPLLPDQKLFLNIFSKPEIIHLIEEAGFRIFKMHRRPPRRNEHNYDKFFILASKSADPKKSGMDGKDTPLRTL